MGKLDVDALMMGVTSLRLEVERIRNTEGGDPSDPTGAWKKGVEFLANSIEMLVHRIVGLEQENEQLAAEVRRLENR